MTMVTKIAMLFHILKTGMSTQSDDTNEKYYKGNNIRKMRKLCEIEISVFINKF